MPSPSREFSAGELNATDSCWLEGLSVFAILMIVLNGAGSVISLGFAVSVLIDKISPLDSAKTSAAAAPSTESSCPHCYRAIFTNLTDIKQRNLGEAYLHPKYIYILGELRFQAAMND